MLLPHAETDKSCHHPSPGLTQMTESSDSAAWLPDEVPDDDGPSERLPWKGLFNRKGKVRPPYNPKLEAFWYRRRELFSKFDRGVRLDAESWASVTPERLAAHMAARLTRGGHGRLVVDPFCGCGGNAIQQAVSDPTGAVLAIDVDPHKVAMARHNARLYGVQGRILFVVGDALSLLPRIRADAVVLSPPWGGIDYDDSGPFDLSRDMAPCCGFRIFEAACAAAPVVAYYLPKNTNRAQIAQLAARHASRACELQRVVRHTAASGSGRKPKSKVLVAFFDAPDPAVAPGVREVAVDDPDGGSSADARDDDERSSTTTVSPPRQHIRFE
eukprot:Transcript_21142.p1 GENE.Transcript_21142~~Transcript_21142.p1  ORF type:complete len:340 (-),score=86.08 Transcript_21142:24-1007(-)